MHLSDAEHAGVRSCRSSTSCTFFFFFFLCFFFTTSTESLPCWFSFDSANWGFCLGCSASDWDVRLHMPPWHQSSSWLDVSRWDGTHTRSFAFSPSSFHLFRFFFFFLHFFSLADSTRFDCVTAAGDMTGSASPSTSKWRRLFFFFFWLTFSAEGLLKSGFWTSELRLLEDLGLFGLVLWSLLVLRERLALGFCSVERRDCFWELCSLKDPREWTKGNDWTSGEWNGLALGREQQKTSGFLHCHCHFTRTNLHFLRYRLTCHTCEREKVRQQWGG